MPPARLAVKIADYLHVVTAHRNDIWVLDGDLGDSYGLYDELGQARFSNFLQMGIAEQTMVAAAAGLAATAQLPWVFSFSAFLCNRACDQIRTCVAHPALPVILVGSHAGAATGKNGKSHAALNDLSVMLGFGGIDVWAPADESDVAIIVSELIARPRPAYIRTSREPVSNLPLPSGIRRSNRRTGEVVLLTTGYASQWAAPVVEFLDTQGIALPWMHLCQVNRLQIEALLKEQPALKHLVVIEDHSEIGGLADLARRVLAGKVTVHAKAWPPEWHGESGGIEEIRIAFGMDMLSLVHFVESLFESYTHA